MLLLLCLCPHFDLFGGHRQPTCHLIGQQLRDLSQKLAKHRSWRVFVPHDGQFVLHQRVIYDGQMLRHVGDSFV